MSIAKEIKQTACCYRKKFAADLEIYVKKLAICHGILKSNFPYFYL